MRHAARFSSATSGGISCSPSGAGLGAPITMLATPPAAAANAAGITITPTIAKAVLEGCTTAPASPAMSVTTSMTMIPDGRWRSSNEPVLTGNTSDRSA